MSTTLVAARRAREDVLLAPVLVSAVAGAVHAALVPSHARESVALGAAFLVAAALQLSWALVAARAVTPVVVRAGIALQLGVAGAWLASRTVGLPVGGHAWTPEPAGVLDVLTTWAELLAVALLLAPRAAGADTVRRATLVLVAVLACVLVSGMGVH